MLSRLESVPLVKVANIDGSSGRHIKNFFEKIRKEKKKGNLKKVNEKVSLMMSHEGRFLTFRHT